MAKKLNMRTRVNFKIRKDLRDWVFAFAKENKVNVTSLIEEYLQCLKDRHGPKSDPVEELVDQI